MGNIIQPSFDFWYLVRRWMTPSDHQNEIRTYWIQRNMTKYTYSYSLNVSSWWQRKVGTTFPSTMLTKAKSPIYTRTSFEGLNVIPIKTHQYGICSVLVEITAKVYCSLGLGLITGINWTNFEIKANKMISLNKTIQCNNTLYYITCAFYKPLFKTSNYLWHKDDWVVRFTLLDVMWIIWIAAILDLWLHFRSPSWICDIISGHHLWFVVTWFPTSSSYDFHSGNRVTGNPRWRQSL